MILGPLTLTWEAFVLFLVTSGITLCFGHSVGMHRKLIHDSFECPLWLERFCVYLGTLVGMAGPFGMIRLHDFRDWAQRQPECHDYSKHNASFFRDAWWQMHCRLDLKHPPEFRLEPRLANDRFYDCRRTHLDVAAVAAGDRVLRHRRLAWRDLGRVRTGRCLRHRPLADRPLRASPRPADLGHRWRVGAGLQRAARRASSAWARAWHNNHHAYPELGEDGPASRRDRSRLVADPCFEALGLAHNIKTPANLPQRPGLRRLGSPGGTEALGGPSRATP